MATKPPEVNLAKVPDEPTYLVRVRPPIMPPIMPPLPNLPLPNHVQAMIPAGGMPRLPTIPLPDHAKAMIPQGGMPNAPKTPQWMVKPSAKLVQDQYIDIRMEEIAANRLPARKIALDLLKAELQRMMPEKRRNEDIEFKELFRIYKAIEKNLQSAKLTVNFECHTWFTNPNPYDTYTQMYERAINGGTMVLKNTKENDADLRAFADNMVTFPKNWKEEKAPQVRGQGPGLSPGQQSRDRIQRQMDTGDLQQVNKPDDLPAFLAGNPQFNPLTKQMFLALNYGRRPHGSAWNYGHSYFEATDKIKPYCFYYAQDTFMRAGKGVDAGAIQVMYDDLGALLEAGGSPFLREAIIQSCYHGQVLPDPERSECKYYLIEAHRFGEFNFRDHVDKMVISSRDAPNPYLWAVIKYNAREFCTRNNVKLFFID